ncbi:MAG: DUF4403 family protein [Gemmatirosa sp.]
MSVGSPRVRVSRHHDRPAPRAGRTVRRRAAWAGAVLALAAAGCDRAPAPMAAGAPAADPKENALPALAALPASELDVPVAYDMAPAVAVLESAVPRGFGDLNARKQIPSRPRLSVAFAASRAPFTVRVRGATATIATVVTYRAKGWYDARFAPDVGGSCGVGSDSAPRLRVALATTVRLDADWALHPRTRVVAVEPVSATRRDRCRVTIAEYDVTERVVAAVRGQLEGKAALVDARLARTDVRRRVENWWTLLQRPIRIRDSLWLEIRPTTIRQGELAAEEGALVAPLTLTATPRIVTGSRPVTAPTPLPRLIPAEEGHGADDARGLRVHLEAALDYASAERALAPKLVGRTFTRGGQRVTVRGARLRGTADGRVALTVLVGGAMEGAVRFVGRPRFDAAAGELQVPDLDFDVASDNVLVRGFDWLKHEALRDTLRDRARWPAAGLIDQARLKLEQALNRDLTKGVRLAATVPDARVLDVRARRDGIVLRAEARGDASLRVTRAPPMPSGARRGRPSQPATD